MGHWRVSATIFSVLATVACGRAYAGSVGAAAPSPTTQTSPAAIATPYRLTPSPISVEQIKKTCTRDPALPAPPRGGLTYVQAWNAWLAQRPGIDPPELVCAVAAQLREYHPAGSAFGDGSEWVWKLVFQTTTKTDSDPCLGPQSCLLPAGSQITGYTIVDYFTGQWIEAGDPAVCHDRLNPACYLPPGE